MFSLCLTLTTIALFCSVVHHRLLSEQPVGTTPTREREASLAPRQGVLWRCGWLEILHTWYTLLDADDRLLHAQPRQARCASSVRCRKKPATVQYSQARYMTVTA